MRDAQVGVSWRVLQDVHGPFAPGFTSLPERLLLYGKNEGKAVVTIRSWGLLLWAWVVLLSNIITADCDDRCPGISFWDAPACWCVAFPSELAEGVQDSQAVVVTVPQALFTAFITFAEHAGIRYGFLSKSRPLWISFAKDLMPVDNRGCKVFSTRGEKNCLVAPPWVIKKVGKTLWTFAMFVFFFLQVCCYST